MGPSHRYNLAVISLGLAHGGNPDEAAIRFLPLLLLCSTAVIAQLRLAT